MKYWTEKLSEKMGFDKARELMNRHSYYYITRDEYEGFLFKNYYDELCILLKTGEVIVNPKEILNTDKEDWFNVAINQKALIQIASQTKLDKYENFLYEGVFVSFDPKEVIKEDIIEYINNADRTYDCIDVRIYDGEIIYNWH